MLRKSLWLPRQQPNFPVEIDPAFTRPKVAWVFNRLTDIPAGLTAVLSGSSLGVVNEPTLIHSAITATTILGASEYLSAAQSGTYIVRYRKSDSTLRVSGLFGNPSTNSAHRCGAHGPYSDGTVYWDFGGASSGTTRLSIASQTFELATWAFTTGPRGMEIWKNGRRIASNTANPTRVAVANNFLLGNHAGDVSDLVNYFLFYAYPGTQLSEGELQIVGNDPYEILRPKSRRIWVPVSAGGATLSGDAATTSTATGSLATSIPLAAAALGVSAASGQVSTAIPVTGNAASVSVAGGALTALIQLSGVAVATAAAAANLTAGSGLSGAAQALASGSADLTIQIRLSGVALATALATGGLTTGAGLSGAALAQASASGALTTDIPLTGAALTVSGATGNLTSIIQLAGVAASVSSAIGSLDVAIRLNGAAVSQALAGGDLTARIQFDGAAVAQAAASGALSAVSSAPTPIERTLRVAAESRTLRVAAESRTLRVAA